MSPMKGAGLGLRLSTRAVFAVCCRCLIAEFVRGVPLDAAIVDSGCTGGSSGSDGCALLTWGRGMYMLSSSDEDSCTMF